MKTDDETEKCLEDVALMKSFASRVMLKIRERRNDEKHQLVDTLKEELRSLLFTPKRIEEPQVEGTELPG
jgi:hypothetical protein